MNTVATRMRIAEIEVRKGIRWLHLHIPLPARKAFMVILAIIIVWMILRMGLIDSEIAELVIRLISAGSP